MKFSTIKELRALAEKTAKADWSKMAYPKFKFMGKDQARNRFSLNPCYTDYFVVWSGWAYMELYIDTATTTEEEIRAIIG